MRLSTKSRYGVRALFDIAYNCGNMPTQIQDISRRQNISPRYLEQIFQSLKHAGLLKSKRGPQGGYCLAKKPEDITVLDILCATESDVMLVDCTNAVKAKRKKSCATELHCVTRSVWAEAADALRNLFGNITLETLCQRGADMGLKKDQDYRFMYYI